MDLTPQQVNEITEIEKQINPAAGPKIINEKVERDQSTLKNLLAALGITIGASAIIIVLLALPSPHKTQQIAQQSVEKQSQQQIVVTTQYVNPFDVSAQYSNPFTVSQNPFTNLSQ